MAGTKEDFDSILSETEKLVVGVLFLDSISQEFLSHVIKKGDVRVSELAREFFYLEEKRVRAQLWALHKKGVIDSDWDYEKESGVKNDGYKLTELGERVRKSLEIIGKEREVRPSVWALGDAISYLSGVEEWLNPIGADMMLALRASGNKMPYVEFKETDAGGRSYERAQLKYYGIVDFGYEGGVQMAYLTQRGADIVDAVYGKAVVERFKQEKKL